MNGVAGSVAASHCDADQQQWVGCSERRREIISPEPLEAFDATFERPSEGRDVARWELPPLAHWLYFLPRDAQSSLGVDGHPRRGGFMPPVSLPRRMWASGYIEFHRPLLVGRALERISTITRIEPKVGRDGPLVFVTIRHDLRDGPSSVLVETQVVVYRDNVRATDKRTAAAIAAPMDEAFARTVMPDPTLLFRYSALTFNSHRIHYDRAYAVNVEGYAGLVVQGPLVATLLIDLVARHMPGVELQSFEFRSSRALDDMHPFTLCGRPVADSGVSLWARDHQGMLAMLARVEFNKARSNGR